LLRLSKKEYWNNRYRYKSLTKTIKFFILKCLPSYRDYLLWDVLLTENLSQNKNLNVLEVGSAPGFNLIKINKKFNFEPYGVEYTEDGVNINRELFKKNNLNPDNIIRSDFFSDEFQKQHQLKYNIVMSFGFIEHFSDVESVIGKHLSLLKKGGVLIITIPNFRGFNNKLTSFFNKDALKIHNLDIMDINEFKKLFNKKKLTSFFCGYYGIVDFALFITKRNLFIKGLLIFLKINQLFLDLIFKIIFPKKIIQIPNLSPSLIFIGKKN